MHGCSRYGGELQKFHSCPQTLGGWQTKKSIIHLFPVSQVSEDCSPYWERQERQVDVGGWKSCKGPQPQISEISASQYFHALPNQIGRAHV